MAGNFGINMNQLTPPAKSNNNSNKTQVKSNHFLETLKGDSSDSSPKDQIQAATTGVVGGIAEQIFGNTSRQENSNLGPQPANFAEYLQKREHQVRFQTKRTTEQQTNVERMIYSRKEEETKIQIKTLQQEIKKLVVATKELSSEIVEAEKTAFATIAAPGAYHLNFFDRIRRLLAIARKRINESKNWLSLFNSRKKQRSIYWTNAKKSGTKYTLSQERYMEMSAG